MSYRIEGLAPTRFRGLFGLSEGELAKHHVIRMKADSKPGFPCRITLEDAELGESLLLLNHVSADVNTPYRSTHAIFVREGAQTAARFDDEVPPMFAGRTLGLRGFDSDGMLRGALLAMPGEADPKIRSLFERPEIAAIHAHNAALGCFVAKIERL
ncbi:MAG TPA: DUF1203 domain-containing protein [Allosphingosinicella sp.]|nr:DUF1203 domain-containing protein [Allosphingosinicella sp.]